MLLLVVCAMVAAGPARALEASRQQFLFAYKLLQRGDHDLAAEAFEQYLDRYPDAPGRGDAVYYRALLHHRGGGSDQAARMLIDVPPTEHVPQTAIDLLRGQVYLAVADHDRAVAALERIDAGAAGAQAGASAHYLLGLAYRGAGNLAAAQRSLAAAAAVDSPLRARALLEEAVTHAGMNRRSEAIETLKRCLEAADGAVAAEAGRLAGDLSFDAGDYDTAIGFYDAVAAGHRGSDQFGPAVVGKLRALLAAARYDRVLEAYEARGAELPAPDRPAAQYLLGAAAAGMGRHEQAVVAFERVAAADADAALVEKALYRLAAGRFRLGEYESMQQALDRLRRRFPRSRFDPDARFLVAAAAAESGDLAGGAAQLGELIAAGTGHPYYFEALLRRATLYREHGRHGQAVDDYRLYLDAADEGDPQRAPVALRLVDLLRESDRLDEARAAAQSLVKQGGLDPAMQEEALYRLALVQVAAGEGPAALATLDTLAGAHPVGRRRDEVEYQRGVLLMSLGRAEAALPLLAAAADRESLPAAQRGGALRLIALHQRRSGAGAGAIATLLRLESVGSLADDERVWLARQFLERENPQAALDYATPVASRDPTALLLVGRAQRGLGRFDAATASLDRLLDAGGEHGPDARLELARVAADRGLLGEALASLEGLISHESSRIAAEAIYISADVQRHRADQRLRGGDRAGAAADRAAARLLLKRLIVFYALPQLAPLPQRAYLSLAEVESDLELPAEAAAAWSELMEKFPDSPHAVYARAALAFSRHRFGEADALLTRLSGEPVDATLRGRMARLREMVELAR